MRGQCRPFLDSTLRYRVCVRVWLDRYRLILHYGLNFRDVFADVPGRVVRVHWANKAPRGRKSWITNRALATNECDLRRAASVCLVLRTLPWKNY